MRAMTLEQLRRIMPTAGSRAAIYLDHLNEAMVEFGVNTLGRQAAFLAQVAHESGQLRYVRELASGVAYTWREDLGNTDPEAIAAAEACGEEVGPFYKGHGLIQITGYANHKACGEALGLDLVHSPTLLESPREAARSAAWFWQTHDLNRYADQGDFDGVCDVVNRGHKTRREGDALGYADRIAAHERAKDWLA